MTPLPSNEAFWIRACEEAATEARNAYFEERVRTLDGMMYRATVNSDVFLRKRVFRASAAVAAKEEADKCLAKLKGTMPLLNVADDNCPCVAPANEYWHDFQAQAQNTGALMSSGRAAHYLVSRTSLLNAVSLYNSRRRAYVLQTLKGNTDLAAILDCHKNKMLKKCMHEVAYMRTCVDIAEAANVASAAVIDAVIKHSSSFAKNAGEKGDIENREKENRKKGDIENRENREKENREKPAALT